MKKITLLIAFLMALVTESYAQVSSYGFSQSAGTYTEITGGTILGTSTTATSFDSTLWAIPNGSIPFTFMFNNNPYTGCSVNSNGYITFGTTTSSAFTSSAISSTTAYNGAIAAWSGDLCGVFVASVITGETRWEVVGTAPNREFVIQFKNWRPAYSSSTTNIPYINFQIRLEETTNNVRVVYGSTGYAAGSTAVSGTRQIGLRGATNADYNNRTNATTVLFTSSANGTSNSVTQAYDTVNATPGMPSNGLTYTWTPPLPCTGTPVAGTVSPASLILNTGDLPGNLVDSGYSSGVAGLTFQWQQSTDGGTNYVNAVGGSGATTSSYTPPVYTGTPILYRVNVTCSSSGLSAYSTPCSITSCLVTSLPSIENFSTYIPGCWQEADNGDLTTGPATFGASTWTADGFANNGTTGAARYELWTTGANDWLISPTYTIPATNYELKFDAAATQFAAATPPTTPWEADDFVEVLVSTTGVNNWTVLYTFNNTNTPLYNGTPIVLDLDAYAGQNVRFAFRAVEGTTNGSADVDFSIDNFQIRQTPTCLEPTGLYAYASSANVADLSWTPGASETLWDIEYGVTGFTLGTGTFVNDVTNPYQLTTLTANTTYQFYVRADCAGSGTSAWVGPYSFTTPCTIYTVPSLENFTTYVPTCWQEADNGDSLVGPATFGASSWVDDGFANNGATGAVRVTIDGATDNDWILSPLYTIPATGYELKFIAAATQSSGTGSLTTPWESDDYVEVLVSNGIDNWNLLYTYNDGNVPSNNGTTNIINLDAFAGQDVRFAFRAVEGTANNSASVDFFIDNFEIRQVPTVVPSCATNVLATPHVSCGNYATVISWNAATNADGYKIKLGTTSGGTEILNNVDLGTALTYNYTGSTNATYYFTIIPYNTVGNATGCSEVSYVTNVNGCYCSSVPSSNDNSGITNVTVGANNFPTSDVTYFDHSATSVDLTQGVNSNVQITFATGYTYDTNIWIDFNNDFDFNDAGELVRTGIASTAANPTTLNASFTMPLSASLGQHRMRIGTADSGQVPPDSCYSGTYGVTLDFTVNILPAPSCIPPTSLSATVAVNSANLAWIAGGSETVWNIEYGVTGFTQGTGIIVNGVANPHVINSLSSNTVYQFYVQANCAGNGLSTWAGPYSFRTACDVTNVPYTQDFESVTVPALPFCTTVVNSGSGNVWATATAPGSGFTTKALRYEYSTTNAANTWFFTQGINLTGGITYRISYNYGNNSTTFVEQMKVAYGTAANSAAMTNTIADHTTINQNAIQTNQVDFVPATTGVYYFGFQAHSIADRYYLFLDNIVITDPALSTDSFSLEGFKVYPNPVRDVLNLSYTKEISKISVHNLLGQEVLSKSVNSMQSQIDLSRLSAGTYFVRVNVDGLENTIKIIKE